MYKETRRPAWVEIDLDAIRFNIREIKNKLNDRKPGTDIIGVVKADSYGHGSVEVAKVLEEEGVKNFAISNLDEAILLRDAGIKGEILMLGLTPDMYVDTLLQYDIMPVVCSLDNAKAISAEAVKQGKTAKVFIAVDTGMGRIGYSSLDENALANATAEVKEMSALPNFEIAGLFSHLATADEADKTFARLQADRYNAFAASLEDAGIALPVKTLANSASVMEIPDVQFDAVRPGIILYGLYPSNEVVKAELDLKPVMSVKADIIMLKTVPAGFSCGYGRKFIAERESVIATIALGYADGYPRPFSSEAKVIVNGKLAPVAGNICMDQCMIDVTDVPGVSLGDEVIVMGSDGVNSVTADDIAAATGTINYEIVCAFGMRLPKVFLNK